MEFLQIFVVFGYLYDVSVFIFISKFWTLKKSLKSNRSTAITPKTCYVCTHSLTHKHTSNICLQIFSCLIFNVKFYSAFRTGVCSWFEKILKTQCESSIAMNFENSEINTHSRYYINTKLVSLKIGSFLIQWNQWISLLRIKLKKTSPYTLKRPSKWKAKLMLQNAFPKDSFINQSFQWNGINAFDIAHTK